MNSNGELSSSVTSSNLSSSLSEHDRLMIPSTNNRHEVIVTDADLRSKRTKYELVNHAHVKSIKQQANEEI
jgi:hypothetical protein